MAESFNPYHKWLGIAPEELPPNHYRLLAIRPFESDADVIASAADQRMAHVRSFQAGKHSALSQKILNEISSARVCLLSPDRKAAYDKQLAEQLEQQSTEGAPRNAISADILGDDANPEPGVLTKRRRKKSPVPALIFAAVFLIVVGAVGYFVYTSLQSGDLDTQGGDKGNGAKAHAASATGAPRTGAADNDAPLPLTSGKASPAAATPEQATMAAPPAESAKTAAGRRPAPSAEEQQAAAAEVAPVLGEDPTIIRLMQLADGQSLSPAGRYVLMMKARDMALASGEIPVALNILDEVGRRFDVDVAQQKLDFLTALSRKPEAAELREVLVGSALALVDQALGNDRREVAQKAAVLALATARKTHNADLIRKATLAIVLLEKP